MADSRSSLYEHDGKTRHSTHSFGLGDIRLTAYRWVFNPSKMPKGNIQFGLGIKLPTGDDEVKDFWSKNGGHSVLKFWGRSINPFQLGDGGTGFSRSKYFL